MNVVTRALTQNLRDIRTNWAGSGPWLLRLGACVLVLEATVLLSGWVLLRVLDDHHFDTSRRILAEAAGAIPFGLGFSLSMDILAGIRPRIRYLLAMWILCSMGWFIVEVDLPTSAGASLALKIAAFGSLMLVARSLRGLLRKYFAVAPMDRTPARETAERRGRA